MSLPPAVDAFVRDNLPLIVIAFLVISFLYLLLFVSLLTRLGKLTRLYRRLTQGTSGGNIEEQLVGYLDKVQGVDERMTALEQRADRLAAGHRRCLQNVGVVRFDPTGYDP